MGKGKKKDVKKKIYPLVSVCTPTYNRRPFIQTMFECFRNQTYPRNRIEWIIVDDGTDKIKDLIDESNIPEIKYFAVDEKLTLGAKRNLMHTKTTGSIIVYMDDDDYYPPERISHAVEKLQSNKQALCAGSSELYIYFKHIQKMYQCGPYGPNHATAGTFAFRKELLSITKYNENASLAEEKEFLHNYTIPFVQLDPLKTILVFSHEHNTFDKRRMLENPNPKYTKVSDKTIEMFIKYTSEESIKKYFMKDIDAALENYKPGSPEMKPDVLKQMKEIDEERKVMMQKMREQQQNSPENIKVKLPGQSEPQPLTLPIAVQIINNQMNEIQKFKARIAELEASLRVDVSAIPN
jgi:glycosyltransferase involved in cell wall biosynthesis